MFKKFKTMNSPLFQASDIEQFCSDMFEKLLREMDMKGSGWSIVKVSKFEVRVSKNNPLRVAGYIPLPKKFTNVVNPRNTETYCFKYCILAKFVTRGNPQSPHSYTLICKIYIIGKIYHFQ